MRTPRLAARRAAAPQSAAEYRREAEHAAATLPPIMVAAHRVASTVAQGVHGRRRVGQGDTFWQFRRYQPGDAIDQIDWRQSAKTQHAYIRENEWEAAQSVWIWRDGSPSMNYRSRDDIPTKGERAAVLALALASLLVRGGEQVALLGDNIAPSSGRAVLNRLAISLSRPAAGAQRSLPLVEPLPRHARIVLIGDFLSPVEELERIVRGYAGRGVSGHLVQILDPAEDALPFRGRIRFAGLEGEGDTLLGRVESVRGDYLDLLRAHRAALSDLVRGIGWTFAFHLTERPPESALLALHRVLTEKPV